MIVARIPQCIPCSLLWSFRNTMKVPLQNTLLSGCRSKHSGKGQESWRDNGHFDQICDSCILCCLVTQNVDGAVHSDATMDGSMRKKILLGPWQPRNWMSSMLLSLAWAHMNPQSLLLMPILLWNITYLHLLQTPCLSFHPYPSLICTLWKLRSSQLGMMVWMQMRNRGGIGLECRWFEESWRPNW